jgi:hypothetical protein
MPRTISKTIGLGTLHIVIDDHGAALLKAESRVGGTALGPVKSTDIRAALHDILEWWDSHSLYRVGNR